MTEIADEKNKGKLLPGDVIVAKTSLKQCAKMRHAAGANLNSISSLPSTANPAVMLAGS